MYSERHQVIPALYIGQTVSFQNHRFEVAGFPFSTDVRLRREDGSEFTVGILDLED